MIVKTEDRVFTISGLHIHEPEWFPEARDDIFQIWFGTEPNDAPRYVPQVGDRIYIDFITGGFSGELWASPILVEVDYEENETIGNKFFKMVGLARKYDYNS